MRAPESCPRCGTTLQPPGLWTSSWTCERHGAVAPLRPAVQPTIELVHHAVQASDVPVWLPWPLPKGWLVTGVVYAGDDRDGARASAVACTGPAPLGGVCDLVLVAEEPGIGLGARYAGLEELDPGAFSDGCAADAKLHADGHPTAVWSVPGGVGRAVYVGEAGGCWLWAVLWPENAGCLLIDEFVLTDLRSAAHEIDIPFGALSPRLIDPEPQQQAS